MSRVLRLFVAGLLAVSGLVLLAGAGGALAVWWHFRTPGPVAYLGGPVLTMDARDRIAAGVGVAHGRIAAVGSEAEIRAWADAHAARVVPLAGRALLPGFIDAHGHFPGAGIYAVHVDLNSPPIGDVEDLDDLVARLAARAAETTPGAWVVGWGYDDSLLAEHRHPTRHDLDRASTRHPIALWHVSGHLGVANSAGLAALGIDAATPDPEGGVIRREAGGAPDGVLEESAAEALRGALLPGLVDSLRMVRRASALYLAAGVTTAQSGGTDRTLMRGLQVLSRLGVIPLRLVLWPLGDAAEDVLAGRSPVAPDDPWVRRGAVKLLADGSIQAYTGYLSRPYHVPPGDDPGYRGYPRIAREDLIREVVRLHRAGQQVAIHGNGDAAIDDILDAFEAAQRASPRPDPRFIVVHAQMARDDQLDRMRALGVIPSFFSLHTWYWGDRHRDRFMGPARAARMSPARSAQRRGLHFTIHCDAPVVPMEPLRLVWSAVNRRSTSGAEIGPAERIAPMQALRAVTIEAAYQQFLEGELGSIAPGKRADLVILSASPLDDPAHIDALRVEETIIDGRSAWRRGG